ncbi:transcriptional regulator [Mesorhizobium sp. B2-2-3]|nr:transcriptional regulator [Mesorhizobium sp. B2-6-4]TPJ61101.1 transcriptional regulator [Mesorhizobium sp. B2-6-1]TPK67441.1 transcriptional regulator [Mesorhizobium sp. B2-5-1]TPM38441.1 transcriptional regulator [Mesorhizobium sp. B2-2-3]TPM62037.1 transcriptional regulator [Mesorhizobium sp. B2-1-9]TPM78915.1 transcriptional regulator [Mesorhizobium sp. B2-1-4]TPM88535.1 transcriptional regulator [Mesorhizobium sp. B2-1-5]TPN13094.1 transcriptional regulator [Mesorhizobium sp. B2-1-2]
MPENDQPRPVNRYVRRRLPSAITLGDRRIAFIRSEITEQIQSRIDA